MTPRRPPRRRIPTVRPLSLLDAPRCAAIGAEEGGPYDPGRWELLLRRGAGLGYEVFGRGLVGAVAFVPYDEGFAHVGKPVVRPGGAARRIARRLILRAVEEARAGAVSFTAAPRERRLLERLGFREGEALEVFRGVPFPELGALETEGATLRGARPSDLEGIARIDRNVLGGSRRGILEDLFWDCRRALVAVSGGSLRGYGILRAGPLGLLLGPLVAEEVGLGRALAAALLQGLSAPVRAVVPARQEGLGVWLPTAGLEAAGGLTTMVLGEGGLPGLRGNLFALLQEDLG